MTNNSVVKSSAVDQLIQYFDISNACLEGLSKVLEGSHEGLVNDICPSATICPKSESLIQQTELHARHAQTISGAMSDPIAKYQDQFEESESAILDKQNPIKDKIRAQIVDTRQTIDALLVQTKLLQTAETCQKERKQIIDDGKIIKNNLQENFEKIATHIRNSNIENGDKDSKLAELKKQTDKEIHAVKRQEHKLKQKIKETHKNISSQTKRIKEQSQLLKTEIKDLQNQFQHLMLTKADKKELYKVFMKTVTALQNASDGKISKKSLKITVKVVKGIISIALTIFQEGITISALKNSLQTVIETGKEVLELYRQENLD